MNQFNELMSGNQPELTIGKIYHLKNGFATSLEYLWFNNCELESIENWNGVKLYTFREKSTDHPICIDGETLFKFHRENNSRCYQYIEKQ